MNGPQGDMSAAKIELYAETVGRRARACRGMREAETPRAEPHDDRRRGSPTADEKYLITGLPVEIADQCGRKTTGQDADVHESHGHHRGRRQRSDPHADQRRRECQ